MIASVWRRSPGSGYQGDNRELVFAIGHTAEMLEALKVDYYAAWHGEKPIEP